MNQKGIAFIPILLWSAIILLGVLVGHDAIQRGYVDIDTSPTETPQPTSSTVLGVLSTPSPNPATKPEVRQPSKNNSTATRHDGSRTGNVIKYHEWCSGNNISIYENELLQNQDADGKTYFRTKGDWDCYWRAHNSGRNNSTAITNPSNDQGYSQPAREPNITCTLSWGTYQLTQSICETYKKMDSDFKGTNDEIIRQFEQASQAILNRTPPPFTVPMVPTPAPVPQIIEPVFDAFDTGMMCTRKAKNNSAGGGGVIFIGGCI